MVLALSALAATLPAQGFDDAIGRLHVPGARARATIELRRGGTAAAKALVDAIARGGEHAAVHAEVLGELGAETRREIGRLVELVGRHEEPVRTSLLRAIANGLLGAGDGFVHAVRIALPGWCEAGWVYTEDPGEPTFAWYEYVRIVRRLKLRRDPSVEGLLARLGEIHRRRGGLKGPFLGGDVHDLGSFGQHATREELEGIAELALSHGDAARDAVAELARYLACEEPRPGIVLKERCAGIGENAPVKSPAVEYPTLWRRDDWRFAIARAVVAIGADDEQRVHALRHLLHAPAVADRMAAIETVRARAQPWDAFASDIAACLQAEERIVVRAALVTLGLADGLPLPVERLRELAAGPDRELAVLSERLLR